jgi:hypothetical protein
MTMYRVRNAVHFEARQFLDGDPNNVAGWLVGANKPVTVTTDDAGVANALLFLAPGGGARLTSGDWIILPDGGTADDFDWFTEEEFALAFEEVPDEAP